MKKDFITAFKLIGTTFSIWWNDWVNQVLANLAALLCSMTIILAPAALLGIFQETQDLSSGVRTGIAGFWQGFKRYFWHSLLWGSINLLVIAIVVGNIWFYSSIQSVWAPLLVVLFIILALFWFMVQFYTLGYLFEQEEKSVFLAWRNGFLTILAAPVFTLVLGFFALLISVISLGLVLPLIVGTPSLIALLSLLAVQNRLEVYQVRQREETKNNDMNFSTEEKKLQK